MATEKWIVHPGETRVIDIEDASRLKVSLVGGQVDIIGQDAPGARIEVHAVTGKDLRIEVVDGVLEVDHPQLRWDNFLEVFKNFGQNGPKAEVSIAVSRKTALTLGIVNASALVAGLEADVRLNSTTGDLLVDGLLGDCNVNNVSGDVQVRGLVGKFNANTVSGDVTVSGEITDASVDAMNAAVFVDASGPIGKASINTVSGNATVRLDDLYPANYVTRSVGGQVLLDGVTYSTSGPTNYSGAIGALSGSFLDARINTVSGDITVLRRTNAAAQPVTHPTIDTDVQWPGDVSSATEQSGDH